MEGLLFKQICKERYGTKIIYDSSIDQNLIKDLKVSVIGFGSQGHAHSLNLHDSGVDVTVGLREDSESFSRAQEMGLKVENLANAASDADVVMLLLPDQVMADVYNSEIADNMKEGATLLFAHGFNIHFNEIIPREDLVCWHGCAKRSRSFIAKNL